MVIVNDGTGHINACSDTKAIACGHFEDREILEDNKWESYFAENGLQKKIVMPSQTLKRKPFNAPIAGRNY